MKPSKAALCFMSLLALAGCRDGRDEAAHTKLQKLDTTVTSLQASIEALEAAHQKLTRDVQFVKLDQRKKLTILDPSTKNYSYFDCDAGRLLVSCESADPYLDGHKVILSIGNPLSITFKGFKLKVRHGIRAPAFPPNLDRDKFEKWQKEYTTWQQSLREKDLNLNDTLSPGTWNRVEVVITPSKPEELGYLEATLETNIISLNTPNTPK